jgi:hypothetical protein
LKEITISVELANAILSYLGNRPYGEVFQIVDAIQQAAKPKEETEQV